METSWGRWQSSSQQRKLDHKPAFTMQAPAWSACSSSDWLGTWEIKKRVEMFSFVGPQHSTVSLISSHSHAGMFWVLGSGMFWRVLASMLDMNPYSYRATDPTTKTYCISQQIFSMFLFIHHITSQTPVVQCGVGQHCQQAADVCTAYLWTLARI